MIQYYDKFNLQYYCVEIIINIHFEYIRNFIIQVIHLQIIKITET